MEEQICYQKLFLRANTNNVAVGALLWTLGVSLSVKKKHVESLPFLKQALEYANKFLPSYDQRVRILHEYLGKHYHLAHDHLNSIHQYQNGQ
jgi:hypothetical protein